MKQSYISSRIQFILPLLTGLIIGLISFFRGDSIDQLSIKLIITIILFYIIAIIIKRILNNMLEKKVVIDSNHNQSDESDRANRKDHEDTV